MKKRLLILIAAVISMCFLLVGCGSDADFLNKETAVKVVFNFEGGKYQNSTAPLIHYYAFEPGTENLIKNPAAEKEEEKFNKSTVAFEDHYFVGWFRTKTEVAEGVYEYTNEWNFKTDKVTSEGVTLYAKWERLIHYTYGVYYKDDAGEDRRLGTYNVQEGDKFDDYLRYARRSGYTAVGFTDENGDPWDENFTHPGGEKSTEIKVYVLFERGEFAEVRTAAELVYYAERSRDIKLMNDIDMSDLLTEEEKLENKVAEFGGFFDFSKILDGNGYTISNFKLSYGQTVDDLILWDDDIDDYTLGISLFGRTSNAIVKNVKFENVTIDIDADFSRIRYIVVAPLCVKAVGSEFTDVSFNGTITLTKLPNRFDEANLTVIDGGDGCYFKDGDSTFDVTVKTDNQIADQATTTNQGE